MTLSYLLKVILMWLLFALVGEVFSQVFPPWALLPAAILVASTLVA